MVPYKKMIVSNHAIIYVIEISIILWLFERSDEGLTREPQRIIKYCLVGVFALIT